MVRFNIFVLFCLAALLSALPLVTAYAKPSATGQTEEKQKDPPRVVLVKEIIGDHKDTIKRESAETGIPPEVIVAVIAVESENNPQAVSSKGAMGLMQTLPIADEATGVRCEAKEPACQIKKGARYIQHLVEENGIPKWSRVFLAYNEGPVGSRKFSTPERVSTHAFVKKCTDYLKIAQAVLAQEI